MGVGSVACKNVRTHHLHGCCPYVNDCLADGDGEFEVSLEQSKDAKFWILVNRQNGIFGWALPDHESPIAEMEFSNCAARVELCKSHGPEELAVGGHGETSIV
jgi:hypothetical protein